MAKQTKRLLIEVIKEKLKAIDFFLFSQIYGKMLNGKVTEIELTRFIDYCLEIGIHVERKKIPLITNKDVSEKAKSEEIIKPIGMFG
jgi:hypothetical protein